MKKKLIGSLLALVLLILLYEVIFRTKTVTYIGENDHWFAKINAKLVGLNGSYSIEVRFKGKEPIQNVDFNIYPDYHVGYIPVHKNGYYYWECKDDCGYYDKESELLFFISWKEKNNLDEKMNFIEMKKISN
jgi:hypothetical protein